MHVMYFTEQPMSAYPADIGLEAGHTGADVLEQAFRSSPAAGSITSTRAITSTPRSRASKASC